MPKSQQSYWVDSGILRYREIWGAGEAVLNNVHKKRKNQKNPPSLLLSWRQASSPQPSSWRLFAGHSVSCCEGGRIVPKHGVGLARNELCAKCNARNVVLLHIWGNVQMLWNSGHSEFLSFWTINPILLNTFVTKGTLTSYKARETLLRFSFRIYSGVIFCKAVT